MTTRVESAGCVAGTESATTLGADLAVLTKAKLSLLVVLTTAAGFISGLQPGAVFDVAVFAHTLVGTLLTAFGASVFNQLMEIEPDRKMFRTRNRPLPAGRISPGAAFALGWLLCAVGIVHLSIKVNGVAAFLAELTLALYLFVYTPMKRRSAWNTIVGAVAGAIPPVIGWAASGHSLGWGALWWFLLLFAWQMPHFYAINWLHREEYIRGGFVMLANNDEDGRRTSRWSLAFAGLLLVLAIWACQIHLVQVWSAVGLLLAGGAFVWLAWKFCQTSDRGRARRLFLGSLLYLPVVLAIALAGKA